MLTPSVKGTTGGVGAVFIIGAGGEVCIETLFPIVHNR
jgi:hypothetical protein